MATQLTPPPNARTKDQYRTRNRIPCQVNRRRRLPLRPHSRTLWSRRRSVRVRHGTVAARTSPRRSGPGAMGVGGKRHTHTWLMSGRLRARKASDGVRRMHCRYVRRKKLGRKNVDRRKTGASHHHHHWWPLKRSTGLKQGFVQCDTHMCVQKDILNPGT